MFAQYTDIHKQSIAKIKGQLKGLYLFVYAQRACVFLPFATMYIFFTLQLTIFQNTFYFMLLLTSPHYDSKHITAYNYCQKLIKYSTLIA